MSKIIYRPVGGLDGIEVTKQELINFSTLLELKYLDEVIPLPLVNVIEQRERLKTCSDHTETQYWETETGSHGWCCEFCGEVTQWG